MIYSTGFLAGDERIEADPFIVFPDISMCFIKIGGQIGGHVSLSRKQPPSYS